MSKDNTDNARIMNTLALIQNKILDDAAKDRAHFFESLSNALALLAKHITTESNAELIQGFLNAFVKNGSLFMKNQDEILGNVLSATAAAVNEMGIQKECVAGLNGLLDSIREEEKDSQPSPDDPLSHIGGGLVIDRDTGEVRTIDADEARRLFRKCQEDSEGDD